MEDDYREKGESRKQLTKEKKGFFLDRMFFWGGGEEKESTEGFYHADCLVFLLTGWREKAPVTDYLIGVDQKIPHW